MAKTIIGLYDDRATARKVVEELEARGFGEDHLRSTTYDDEGKLDKYDVDPDEGATVDALTGYGIPDDEANFYAEAVRRGGILVIARVHDQDAETAADIMARHNPVPYEQRSAAYREEGFETYEEAEPYGADEILEERERYADDRVARMKEIEEQLKICKREVVRGGVKVHKYVDTDVVEETLRLREEHIDVDRRAVDREATEEDLADAFTEDEVELTERSEEAVVEKTARVTGEVAVGKDVNYREEKVGGEVRKTRVEVEETAGEGAVASDTDWETVEANFRDHYDTAYATAEHDYDTYEPAYRYGYDMASDTRYRDRDFNDVEADLRKGYVKDHDESLWEETKDAVRHAYNSVRRAV